MMNKKNHYCEQCKKSHHKHGESHFMSGAVLGALVGAALGVLFAPAPGEKTRKKLKESGRVALDKAEDIAEEVRVAAAPLLAEVEKSMVPVLKKAKASGKDVQEQVLERIEQIVDEAEDIAGDASKSAKRMFKNLKK